MPDDPYHSEKLTILPVGSRTLRLHWRLLSKRARDIRTRRPLGTFEIRLYSAADGRLRLRARCPLEAGRLDLDVPQTGGEHYAELGVLSASGRFSRLLRSESARSPQTGPPRPYSGPAASGL